jgi:hypothetical protein
VDFCILDHCVRLLYAVLDEEVWARVGPSIIRNAPEAGPATPKASINWTSVKLQFMFATGKRAPDRLSEAPKVCRQE